MNTLPKLAFTVSLALLFTLAFAQPQPPFTDTRDGKSYRAVKIGEQIWMAENLNYDAEGSRCYDNKPENCAKYGRLYNWKMAMKVCPSGWHLPSNEEWDVLYKYVDSSYVVGNHYSEDAGKYLKATSGWNNDEETEKSGNGMDIYAFAALPGGFGYLNGSFYHVGISGFWWSASERNADFAYFRCMRHFRDNANWSGNYKDKIWFSVRCVRD